MKRTFVSFRENPQVPETLVYAGKDFNKRNAATERLFKSLMVSIN